jgi:hypothetical protein
MEWSIR